MKVVRPIPHVLACAALAALTSCGSSSPARGELVFSEPVNSFPGFSESNLQAGVFYAQAAYENDTKSELDVDVAKAANVVPILLRITLSGEIADDVTIELKSDRMDPHLYLEDGTVMRFVPALEVAQRVPKKHRPTVEDTAFAPRLMRGRNDEISGYLYFEAPEGVRTDGGSAYSTDAAGGVHALSLRRSLLAFEYLDHVDGVQKSNTVNVGLKK